MWVLCDVIRWGFIEESKSWSSECAVCFEYLIKSWSQDFFVCILTHDEVLSLQDQIGRGVSDIISSRHPREWCSLYLPKTLLKSRIRHDLAITISILGQKISDVLWLWTRRSIDTTSKKWFSWLEVDVVSGIGAVFPCRGDVCSSVVFVDRVSGSETASITIDAKQTLFGLYICECWLLDTQISDK